MGWIKQGARGTILVAVTAALVIGPSATPAGADVIGPQNPNEPKADSPWQAGTCKSDAPKECSVETPDQFFEQTAGHPSVGFTQFIVNGTPGTIGPPLGRPVPNEELRTVRVDLPAGLTVNPQSTPVQCVLPPGPAPKPAPRSRKSGSASSPRSPRYPRSMGRL